MHPLLYYKYSWRPFLQLSPNNTLLDMMERCIVKINLSFVLSLVSTMCVYIKETYELFADKPLVEAQALTGIN